MKKFRGDTSGFGMIELLVLFVGIGIIGFVGWYVWQARANASSSYNASADLNVVAAAPRPGGTPASATPYLIIKELGIRIPLTTDIKDLVYSYDKTHDGEKTAINYLHFSTTSISAIPNSGTTCELTHDPLGTYTVYMSRQKNEGTADSQAGTLEATVNGYYLYYKHVQYGCGDSTTDANRVAILIAPLVAAVKKA